MIDMVDAILSLRPNAMFSLMGDDYENIEWFQIDNPPTLDEVKAEQARLQAEYDALEYQRLRAQEYPTIADQLDMLYHKGLDGWKSEIDKVKQKYPKNASSN